MEGTSLAMPYGNLFGWWIACITFNILFVAAASIYLYMRKRPQGLGVRRGLWMVARVIKDFAFVWVLLGLLLFYVYSVGEGSSLIFAVGNVVVQILLIIYIIGNGDARQQ